MSTPTLGPEGLTISPGHNITFEQTFYDLVKREYELMEMKPKYDEISLEEFTYPEVCPEIKRPIDCRFKTRIIKKFGIITQENEIISIYADKDSCATILPVNNDHFMASKQLRGRSVSDIKPPDIGSHLGQVIYYMEEPSCIITGDDYFRLVYNTERLKQLYHPSENIKHPIAFEFNVKKAIERIIVGEVRLSKHFWSYTPEEEMPEIEDML